MPRRRRKHRAGRARLAVTFLVAWGCCWSTQADAGRLKRAKVKFVTSVFGGDPTGAYDHVSSVFFDSKKKRLYVADMKNNRLLAYDNEFRYVSEFDADGRLVTPFSLVRDSQGRFYVTERKENRVLVIEVAKHAVRPLDLSGIKGRHPVVPSRLAIGVRDELYVIDEANRRILMFEDERFVKGFGSPPTGFNDVCTDRSGKVYAVDSLAGSVFVYSGQGSLLLTFGKKGEKPGEFYYPSSVAVDWRGRIYVADQHADRILAFNEKGRYLFSFSETGWREGRLKSPSYIFLDGRGLLYVVDRDNERIEVFSP